MKNKKRILIITLVALVILVTAFASKTLGIEGFLTKAGQKYAQVKSNDKVVATVNKKPIYLSLVTLYYLGAKEMYTLELSEFKKNYPNNYKQFLTKPDPFKFLNSCIDEILLDDYAKKIGVKPDREYLKNLISQQKKEFFYIINGMPQSEMNRMPKTNQETYKEESKIVRDMVKASGMSPEEYFKKKEIPVLEYSARMEALKKQMEKNVKVPQPTSKEIEDFMKYRKGITKDEAISVLREQKARSIVESKIKNLISQLRKNANIKIIDEDSLKKLVQENP